MSSDTAGHDGSKWPLRFGLLILLFVVFILPGGEHLLLGWLYFPLRAIPRITIDTPAAVLGVINLLAFIIGLHIAIRWFTRSTLTSQTAPNVSWRSTLAISCTLLLMFAAGTAMVGATHQFIWLLVGRSTKSTSAPEPVFGIIHAARSSARRMQASNSLKQMTMGAQNFHDNFQALPPGGTMNEEGELLHGWASFTGEFFAFSCDRFDYSIPWNQPPNAQFYKCNLWMFVNPSIRGPYFDKQGFGLSHFAGNSHVLPIRTINVKDLRDRRDWPLRQLHETKQLLNMSHITDGTSNTILHGTVTQRFKPWGHPANIRDPSLGIDRSPNGFGGPPSWNGAVFSFCDGHTALINRKIDPRVLHQLATPAGGEPPVPGY
jgi:hypothetical protein